MTLTFRSSSKFKISLVFIAMFMSLLHASSALAEAYGGGGGTPENPYLISELTHLQVLQTNSTDWSRYFKQTTNINASLTVTWNSGAGCDPVGNETTPFTGNYNGDGHTIDGLVINRSGSSSPVGLFGKAYNATIADLGITNCFVLGSGNSSSFWK